MQDLPAPPSWSLGLTRLPTIDDAVVVGHGVIKDDVHKILINALAGAHVWMPQAIHEEQHSAPP